MKKLIAILFLFLVTSQLVAAGMKYATGQQVLLLEVEEKTDGDKNGKDVKAEKKEGKECYTYQGLSYAPPFSSSRHYSLCAMHDIPFPVFETQTPPPNVAC